MVDVVSAEKRSQMMSGIRGKNTIPEISIRKGLFRYGIRYKLHDKILPGKPDLVFPKYKAVVLVNGCYWHGHDCHLFKWPSSRREFWKAKITRNREKDLENLKALQDAGWRVLIVWECAVKGRYRKPLDVVTHSLRQWLVQGSSFCELRGGQRRAEANGEGVSQPVL